VKNPPLIVSPPKPKGQNPQFGKIVPSVKPPKSLKKLKGPQKTLPNEKPPNLKYSF